MKNKKRPVKKQSVKKQSLSKQSVRKQSSGKQDSAKLPRGRHVVGIHSCLEVIKVRPKSVHSVWLKEGWERHSDLQKIHEWAQENSMRLHVQDKYFFDQISHSHQGVCFVVNERPHLDWQSLKSDKPCIIVFLDGIEDPHNLGAILRTCWLMGVKAIFIPHHNSAGLSPAANKVASGAAEHVPVEEVSNLAAEIVKLKELGFWVYGAAFENSENLWSVEFTNKVIIVIGAEDKGIRKPVLNACDHIINIPQVESQASYNASVATSIILAEATRQQRCATGLGNST